MKKGSPLPNAQTSKVVYVYPQKKPSLIIILELFAGGVLLGAVLLTVGFSFLVYQTSIITLSGNSQGVQDENSKLSFAPFPIGVNPNTKIIEENPRVDAYFNEHIVAQSSRQRSHTGFIGQALAKLVLMDWYQNLASPTGRILIIRSGERKEEIAKHFSDILAWTDEERLYFLSEISNANPAVADGKFFPGTYLVPRKASPDIVIPLVTDKFKSEVANHYSPEIEALVSLEDALTIASLLEREAYDFDDMRQISGVIWNRLFSGMRLQIDATLQYSKAEKTKSWWPEVVPADKLIASPFNTYKNAGLPPAPIANPSLDAILAALNPRKTDCMFYFHDANAGFHCSKTYEEHVALLKQYYGRGR